MRESISKSIPKEINIQKEDIFKTYRDNSQFHYKDISDFKYELGIKLNPSREKKTMDIRYQFPLSHVQNSLIKNNYLSQIENNKQNAFDKADIQSKITSHIKKQKYQNLLKKDKYLEHLCNIKNNEIKAKLNKRKNNLKKDLTKIIVDALIFSKKNNPLKSMLPDNINEIVDKVKNQTRDMSLSLNISNLSQISSLEGESKPKKNEFLTLLGVDLDNLTVNHVDVDINKVWDYVSILRNGKNIEDILRYKVVNAIMSMTEKKASEKAKKIYEKMEIYNKYMERKRLEAIKKKQKEEEEKYQDMLKNNPRELIRLKMVKSLSEPKLINKYDTIKKKKDKKSNTIFATTTRKNKMKKSENVLFLTSRKHKKRFNSYNDVNKIINFIDDSKKGSQSKLCRDHFVNIQAVKSMDIKLKKMLEKNAIKV